MSRRTPTRPGPALEDRLTCPGCGAEYAPGARFCERCRLPLVFGDPADASVATVSEARERARKVKPQLAEGELVTVAHARNQAEGEFIQGLLLEEGVPSVLRRSAGFDVPDFLAAGPRDVMVAQSGVDAAREVLLEADILSTDPSPGRPVAPVRLALGLLVSLGVGVLVIWLLAQAIQ
jgi:hypothetical protein